MSAGTGLVPMLSLEHGVRYGWNHGPTRWHGASVHVPEVMECEALPVAMLVSVARRTVLNGLRGDRLTERMDAGAGSYRG